MKETKAYLRKLKRSKENNTYINNTSYGRAAYVGATEEANNGQRGRSTFVRGGS